jgi:RNA polymerase sigma-70 factor (ECF subfamily)
MERHLEGCHRCRGACDSLKQTLALCRTTGADAAVPPEVQARVKAALSDFVVTRS